MDRIDGDRWLDAYVAAWKSYDRNQSGASFSDDVVYRSHAYDDPGRGRDDVIASWLGEGDFAGASSRDPEWTYDVSYQTIAVEDDVAVALGSSTDVASPGGPIDRIFDNCLVTRFDHAGTCREFTEWYLRRPGSPTATSAAASWAVAGRDRVTRCCASERCLVAAAGSIIRARRYGDVYGPIVIVSFNGLTADGAVIAPSATSRSPTSMTPALSPPRLLRRRG